MSRASETLTGSLLQASAALQRACAAAREQGNAPLFHELRKAGWIVADALTEAVRAVPGERVS